MSAIYPQRPLFRNPVNIRQTTQINVSPMATSTEKHKNVDTL